MAFFWVLAGIVLLVLILLLLPVTVEISFNDDFVIKVRYIWFLIFPAKKSEHNKSTQEDNNHKPSPKKESMFKKYYRTNGLVKTVKCLCRLLRILIKKLWFVFKRIYIKNFNINITVSLSDSAKTAIGYGTVCAAVYPTLDALSAVTNCSFKKVDISADFEKGESLLSFSAEIKISLILLLIAAVGGYFEYKKQMDVNVNE